ncbi:MAG: LysR substrate-binding domain-containing protein [Castellaniella sp.]|uniref:LysR family transcriptional regulator n=1 Tax=Castellaniella sp. TaxID=1955812 RepID=UPI003C7269A2
MEKKEKNSFRKLSLHQADLLYRVINSRTLTDAAAAMHISQPAVSKQLQTLQQSLGIKLFHRQGNRLVPTAESLLLAEQVGRAHASVEVLNRLAANIRNLQHGELSICASPSIATHWLSRALAPFWDISQLDVRLNIANSVAVMDFAETGQVDLGIGVKLMDRPSAVQTELFTMYVSCLVPRHHALGRRQRLMLDDLVGYPFILGTGLEIEQIIGPHFQRGPLSRNVRCRVEMSVTACQMAKQSDCIAVVDSLAADYYTDEHYVSVPIWPRLLLPVCLVTSSTGAQSIATQTLIEHLRAVAFKESAQADQVRSPARPA